jgi:hypothetical protein
LYILTGIKIKESPESVGDSSAQGNDSSARGNESLDCGMAQKKPHIENNEFAIVYLWKILLSSRARKLVTA